MPEIHPLFHDLLNNLFKKRVNYLSCIEGNADLTFATLHKMPCYLFLYYKISFIDIPTLFIGILNRTKFGILLKSHWILNIKANGYQNSETQSSKGQVMTYLILN